MVNYREGSLKKRGRVNKDFTVILNFPIGQFRTLGFELELACNGG